MHRLYRESTHYKNGVHVKDLNRLNRNVNRIVALDDDMDALQFNPDNLIRIKPYDDPTDRTDNTLERITPFLIEIARQGCNDVPAVLRQFRGLDADGIADEFDRRVSDFKENQLRRTQRGLGGFANRGGAADLPPPELSPVQEDSRGGPPQLTAKDLVGAAPTPVGSGGMMQFLNQRAQEKEEQNRRKFEKWNEVMMKKQQEKQAAATAAAGH
eukprot:CAMPEP_0116566356 /NCGR_PEP_ID=MMETSP0397-20121206/14422_1 /TAXON_ID=216820 /ORGANISM="Cyclophora tenuis, Strain ECT3854" /LENGTH=212 /DNA_ID=CAMNT_0004093259 /DNA_START=148 /DNA_END=786 /DNA_ORIENTATION=-